MALEVSVALTLGSRLYDRQGVALRLRRTQLAAVDRLEIALPADVKFDAEPGDPCSLELDGGDGAAKVFNGKLTHIRKSLSGLELTAHNGGRQLAIYRPFRTYEQLTIGEVIGNLCSDADVEIGENIEGATLAHFVANGCATAAQEVARLAALTGAAGAFDADGVLHVNVEGGIGDELALRFGRELVNVEASQAQPETTSIVVVGEGAGDPASAEGRWIITDFLRGGGSEAGPATRRIAEPELRTTADTKLAAAAFTQRRRAAASSVKLRTWWHPKIAPGMRLEFADLPGRVPLAECRVRQVVSSVTPGGRAMTDVWATADAGGASALEGLVGAVGAFR